MSTRTGLNFKCVSLIFCVCVFISGCTSPQAPTQTIEATTTPVPGDKSIISAQIQNTLNDYNTGLKNNDKILFMSIVDQDNQTISKVVSSNFDDMESSGFPQKVKLGMTVIGIEQKDQDRDLDRLKP